MPARMVGLGRNLQATRESDVLAAVHAANQHRGSRKAGRMQGKPAFLAWEGAA